MSLVHQQAVHRRGGVGVSRHFLLCGLTCKLGLLPLLCSCWVDSTLNCSAEDSAQLCSVLVECWERNEARQVFRRLHNYFGGYTSQRVGVDKAVWDLEATQLCGGHTTLEATRRLQETYNIFECPKISIPTQSSSQLKHSLSVISHNHEVLPFFLFLYSLLIFVFLILIPSSRLRMKSWSSWPRMSRKMIL
jgi:hypothetical protein